MFIWLSEWLPNDFPNDFPNNFPNNFPNYFLNDFLNDFLNEIFFSRIWISSQLPNLKSHLVWCLKVLSSSQNLLHHIPVFYVKCPISILQNSWQLKILWKLPLFELDSKAALARYLFFWSLPLYGIISFLIWKLYLNRIDLIK